MLKQLVCVLLVTASLPRGGHSLGSRCNGELGRNPQGAYWLEQLPHEGMASFNPNPGGYRVFRNVRDYGAVGDGNTDDTAAITAAITEGNRCGPGCGSSTQTPAIVYFPAGNYLISSPVLMYYFTQFIGDAVNLPTLIMAPQFNGLGLIESDDYGDGGNEIWANQNNFYRQIRNFNIDLTRVPPGVEAHGIHWQVAQATSITNVHVRMSTEPGTNHEGLWMENGSGGFFSDVTFDGGRFGLWIGNQQFTTRNVAITNADTAIYLNWNWGWTFKDIRIENCRIGLDISSGGEGSQLVGSALLFDSDLINVQIGVLTSTTATSQPTSSGTLTLDNVRFTNVGQGVVHTGGAVLLPGGSQTVQSWGQGPVYDRSGARRFLQGDLPAPTKPAVLLDGQGNFFSKPKPSYTDVALEDFISVKAEGAVGDGRTDDTNAIQTILDSYAGCKVIFFPAGHYVVSNTINVPAGTRIIGEIWSGILATGPNFGDPNNPRPVFQLGQPNEEGIIEISEMLFSTAGPAPGAIMTQIHIREPGNEKGGVGLWDVHYRIGGASGTQLQTGNCGKSLAINKPECFGAFLMLHIASTGSAYLENVWAWVSDHDLDGADQVSIYNARGVLDESVNGPVWMYGTASEHSVLYQYNFVDARNVILAMIQTETPYYQATPPAPTPVTVNNAFSDPDYTTCPAGSLTCPMAYGLRLLRSSNFYLYGAGLYNFFQNYDQACLDTENCQDVMVVLENSNADVYLYNVNTKAADTMIRIDGVDTVKQIDNRNTFCSSILALLP